MQISFVEECAQILATGLMRLRSRKSSQIPCNSAESSLDLSPDQSGDANRVSAGESDD